MLSLRCFQGFALAACLLMPGVGLAQEGATPPAQDVVPVGPPPVLAVEDAPAGFQQPAKTVELIDGRTAMVFASGDNLPPLPEGYTREEEKDGRVIYFSPVAPPGLIPMEVRPIIAADGPYKVLHTGAVTAHTVLISVPYRHKQVFRLTEDHVVKVPFMGSKVLAPAGTMGFHAGLFKGGLTGVAQMLCYFPPDKDGAIDYTRPTCGLGFGGRTDLMFELVGTTGNLPVSYTITTIYGASTAPMYDGFKSEATSDRIPYDFTLDVRFVKWTGKGVTLTWGSGTGVVEEQVYPLDGNGQAVVQLAEGTLTVTPDKKNKKAATVDWVAKEAVPDNRAAVAPTDPSGTVPAARP